MDDKRRPISWDVEFDDNSLWDELEQWALDHNVDVDKLVPGHKGDIFERDFSIVYRARLTCWDKNTVLLGKLRWGGKHVE
jgi:hypothetical protein